MTLTDSFNRKIDYLRIGLTDKCNLRCRYCMPAEGIDFASNNELLSNKEIIRLTRIFAELGIKKVRLTGGEPFVRKDIEYLLGELSSIIPNIHITTNATLLNPYLGLLKDLKVSGLNVSIDSLDQERFAMITRRDTFTTVMDNILACVAQEIPIKLNVVVMNGVNDLEIVDFIKFGLDHNIEVRFIEAMPFNDDDGNKAVFMPESEIFNQIKNSYPLTQKLFLDNRSSADSYLLDGKYQYAIIPSYTRSLCGSCNRVRLTPKGELMTCLYAQGGYDLKKLLRDGTSDDEYIKQVIIDATLKKKKTGFEEEAIRQEDVFRSMTTIGG